MDCAELFNRTLRLTQLFAERRVGPSFRVLGWTRRPDWLQALLLASADTGASLVPLAPAIGRDALIAITERMAPTLIVADEPFVGEPAGVVHLADLSPGGGAPRGGARAPESERPLLVLPSAELDRFIMLSERALLAAGDALAARLEIGEADRLLVLLPELGPGPFLQLAASIVPLSCGATAILDAGVSGDPAAAFARGLAAGATIAVLTPHQLEAVLAGPAPERPASLRLVLAGGGALAPELGRRFEAALGVPVAAAYGVPELCGLVTARRSGAARRDVGTPLAGEIRIDAPRPRGAEAGEIVARGPTQMIGYYKDPRLTRARATADGWIRTGDLGYIDGDGNLVVTGRCDDLIVCHGRRIVVPELDAVARAHPAVAEARTISVRDAARGERIHTACVLRPGAAATADELAAWLRERRAPGEAPDEVSVLGRLPRTADGDVAIALLRGIVSGELARAVYGNLTRPRFRRAPPSDGDSALRAIDRALRAARPVRFVAHWGAGRRGEVREVDVLALERLRAFLECAAPVPGVGAEMLLLLADVHAKVNEQDPGRVEAYFDRICCEAEALSDSHAAIRCRRLSELWREHGLDVDEVLRAAEALDLGEDLEGGRFADVLLAQAGRRANGDPRQAARRYYHACRIEAPIIAAAYPEALWLSYADPAHGHLLPPLPRFYLFSYRRGRTNRPWFEDEAV